MSQMPQIVAMAIGGINLCRIFAVDVCLLYVWDYWGISGARISYFCTPGWEAFCKDSTLLCACRCINSKDRLSHCGAPGQGLTLRTIVLQDQALEALGLAEAQQCRKVAVSFLLINQISCIRTHLSAADTTTKIVSVFSRNVLFSKIRVGKTVIALACFLVFFYLLNFKKKSFFCSLYIVSCK